jgi:hypothetical protein
VRLTTILTKPRQEVLPERGRGLRPPSPVGLPVGPKMVIMALRSARRKSGLQGKVRGVSDPRPLGAGMDTSASGD